MASGRLIREEPIRRALDAVIDSEATRMRALTQSLLDGGLSLSAWESSMLSSIKSLHLVGLSTASGGWYSLDSSDFGWVGRRIRDQYEYLRGFAADLASGKQPLNGTALARAEMYASAARSTHRAAIERAAKERGLEQERNQLGSADHCGGCLGETARGWVAIGSLVPCGSRTCRSRCHCSIVYRMKAAA